MKSNELRSQLRLGNYLDTYHGIVQVTEINSGKMFPHIYTTPNNIGATNIHGEHPIPLTEDWLKKLGFKQWGSFKYLWKVKPQTTCTINGLDSCVDGFELNDNYRVKVEYVHQLQNLYFALTGEELKLKS